MPNCYISPELSPLLLLQIPKIQDVVFMFTQQTRIVCLVGKLEKNGKNYIYGSYAVRMERKIESD